MIHLLLAALCAPQADVDPLTLRVVVLGDDWAAGPNGGWPSDLESRLAPRLDGVRIEVESLARAGETTGEGLRRFGRDVLGRDADIVVLHYGFADSAIDLPNDEDFPRVAPGAFRSNLRDLVAASRASGAEVVLVQHGARLWTDETRAGWGREPFDTTVPFGFDRIGAAYAGLVEDLATAEGVALVPTHTADLLRGAEECASMRTDGRRPSGAARSWLVDRVAAEVSGMARDLSLPPLSAHRGPSRGWTLPELDLATDPARVIEVDRDPDQYLGHPSTVRIPHAEGATILCAYPEGHGRGPIVLKRSEDGGRTWSERLPTPASWATSKETPVFLRIPRADAEGHRLVLFEGLFPARRAISDDDGATWSELEPPTPGTPWGGIVVVGDHAVLGPGHALAWFHDDGRFLGPERRPRRFRLFQIETRDAGLTWSAPREILSYAHADYCEPGLVREGDRLALLLRENSRRRNSAVIVSDDRGTTWSTPRPVAGALTGDRHQAERLPDGRWFVSFRDTGLESPRWGDWVGWVGSFEDILEGRQGDLRVRLMDNHRSADCAYPALEWTTGGALLALTYGHWTPVAPPWIAALRIEPDELSVR